MDIIQDQTKSTDVIDLEWLKSTPARTSLTTYGLECGKFSEWFQLPLAAILRCDAKKWTCPVSTGATGPKVRPPNAKASIGDVVGILGLLVAAPAGLVAVLALFRYFRLQKVTRREKHGPQGELSLGRSIGVVKDSSSRYTSIKRRHEAYVVIGGQEWSWEWNSS